MSDKLAEARRLMGVIRSDMEAQCIQERLLRQYLSELSRAMALIDEHVREGGRKRADQIKYGSRSGTS